MLLLLCFLACGDDGPTSAATGDGGSQGDGGSAETMALDLDPACMPFNMGGDCATPWPSVFHMAEDAGSSTGLRLAYSVDMLDSPDGELPVDPAIMNFFDGVSPTSPLLVNLGRDVDPAFLAGHRQEAESLAWDAAIALVRVETGERVPLLTELDQNNRDMGYDGRHALILRPLAPMEPGERYVAALSTALTDVEGQAFDAPAAFVALRDGISTDSDTVEAMRPRYEDVLFPVLDQAGMERDDLLVAWELQVASEDQVLGPIRSMRDQALETIADQGLSYTLDSVQQDVDEDVAWLIEGTFAPPGFLLDQELVYAADGYSVLPQEEQASYEFTMVVPKDLPHGAAVPLVVVGHGIFGRGRDYLTSGGTGQLFQAMAHDAGVVVIATDWIGLSGGDLDLIIEEVLPDIARIRIVTDRLAQSLVNNVALVELAYDELQFLDELDGEVMLDPDALYYYGVSLGGIQGTSFTALHPDVSRAVVSVPGAGWTHMIQRSWHFAEIELLLDLLYPDPLTQLVFISALQSFFDASDPVNLGRLLRGTDKNVIIQEAIGDCQVPNLATDILVRTTQARHLDESPWPIFEVDTVDGPVEAGVSLTQIVLPDSLDAYFPPDANTIPPENNGTHSDAVQTEAALGQTLELVLAGQALHPCSGPCDPD